MLGDKLSAEQAEKWGMIWQCVDDDVLMEEVMSLAQRLAAAPPLGLAMTKKLLNDSFSNPLHQQLELEKEAMNWLGKTEDYQEGVRAFMEKRQATFIGK